MLLWMNCIEGVVDLMLCIDILFILNSSGVFCFMCVVIRFLMILCCLYMVIEWLFDIVVRLMWWCLLLNSRLMLWCISFLCCICLFIFVLLSMLIVFCFSMLVWMCFLMYVWFLVLRMMVLMLLWCRSCLSRRFVGLVLMMVIWVCMLVVFGWIWNCFGNYCWCVFWYCIM